MTLYSKIAETIEERIRSGRYRPGEKIPSVRQTASEFGCNKLTVLKAFDRLKRDGYLENKIGSGSFVRYPEKIARSGHVFDFRTAYISESFFPYLKAKKIFANLFELPRNSESINHISIGEFTDEYYYGSFDEKRYPQNVVLHLQQGQCSNLQPGFEHH